MAPFKIPISQSELAAVRQEEKALARWSRGIEEAVLLSVWRDQLRDEPRRDPPHCCAWLVVYPVWREPTPLGGKQWKELKWTRDTFSKEKSKKKKHKNKNEKTIRNKEKGRRQVNPSERLSAWAAGWWIAAVAAEEVPPKVSPNGFVLHEIEKNPSWFLFCLHCSSNQASHFTPSFLLFLIIFFCQK